MRFPNFHGIDRQEHIRLSKRYGMTKPRVLKNMLKLF